MKRIIIIDDDPYIQDALELIFSQEDYELIAYADGSAVLDHSSIIPDLFILDKQLAGIDGLDLCRIIKDEEQTKNVPVIILSASEGIRKSAKSAGADEVLQKPFRIKTMRDCVSKYLKGSG